MAAYARRSSPLTDHQPITALKPSGLILLFTNVAFYGLGRMALGEACSFSYNKTDVTSEFSRKLCKV